MAVCRWPGMCVSFLLLFLAFQMDQAREIKGSMGNKDWCANAASQVQWLSEKTYALITGKSGQGKNFDGECKVIFGVASDNEQSRIRLHFNTVYFHTCGVQMLINQSADSTFEEKDQNEAMYYSGCSSGNPGDLYAQPRQYVQIVLWRKSSENFKYNFRMNISVAERLPASGPRWYSVAIVGFVAVVVVVFVAVILLKYIARISAHWQEEQREEAMTRAIRLFNSQEPLEEADMVAVQPGVAAGSHSQSDSSHNASKECEIAFVHADGRVERFVSLNNSVQNRNTAVPSPAQDAVSSQSEDEPTHCPLSFVRSRISNVTTCVTADAGSKSNDNDDTMSVGRQEMPPSYEEALEMPMLTGASSNPEEFDSDDGEQKRESQGTNYMNLDLNVHLPDQCEEVGSKNDQDLLS